MTSSFYPIHHNFRGFSKCYTRMFHRNQFFIRRIIKTHFTAQMPNFFFLASFFLTTNQYADDTIEAHFMYELIWMRHWTCQFMKFAFSLPAISDKMSRYWEKVLRGKANYLSNFSTLLRVLSAMTIRIVAKQLSPFIFYYCKVAENSWKICLHSTLLWKILLHLKMCVRWIMWMKFFYVCLFVCCMKFGFLVTPKYILPNCTVPSHAKRSWEFRNKIA